MPLARGGRPVRRTFTGTAKRRLLREPPLVLLADRAPATAARGGAVAVSSRQSAADWYRIWPPGFLPGRRLTTARRDRPERLPGRPVPRSRESMARATSVGADRSQRESRRLQSRADCAGGSRRKPPRQLAGG